MILGDLTIPEGSAALVVFAHGSGSGRKSPRGRKVAAELHKAGIGTLLVDLLTAEEAREDAITAELRFDIRLLASRVVDSIAWLTQYPQTRMMLLGCYGASTGAAAALVGAARRPDAVKAVVSRGGRPDLAAGVLGEVCAPTLLIVGENDPEVLELNRKAAQELRTTTRIEVIPGASHLFEEPGALEQVARLTREWFEQYLVEAVAGRR